MALKKPSNVLRLLFENANSIEVFSTGKAKLQKLDQMRYLIKKYDIDIAAFAETQIDWRQVTQESSYFGNFSQGQEKTGGA